MSANVQLEIGEVRDASLHAVPGELGSNEVHLWQRPLQNSAEDLAACHELLSPEERERAARYRVERPRSDYILTRGTLRSLLAHYLHRTPHDVSFRYTEYGKPLLPDDSDLRFNVSHSQGLALMAFIRGREVGVDVEKVRRQNDVEKIAERFFSLHERRELERVSGDDLHQAFFRCWTRKEAYIKAKGEGLSLPLHQFDVSIDPNPKQALLATRPDASEAGRWELFNISIHPGYAAALAVERSLPSRDSK